MHRIFAPTPAMAQALADLITDEGGLATVIDERLVLIEAGSRLVDSACLALSIGDIKRSTRAYARSHYARSV